MASLSLKFNEYTSQFLNRSPDRYTQTNLTIPNGLGIGSVQQSNPLNEQSEIVRIIEFVVISIAVLGTYAFLVSLMK
jgi:hypothetical protein